MKLTFQDTEDDTGWRKQGYAEVRLRSEKSHSDGVG